MGEFYEWSFWNEVGYSDIHNKCHKQCCVFSTVVKLNNHTDTQTASWAHKPIFILILCAVTKHLTVHDQLRYRLLSRILQVSYAYYLQLIIVWEYRAISTVSIRRNIRQSMEYRLTFLELTEYISHAEKETFLSQLHYVSAGIMFQYFNITYKHKYSSRHPQKWNQTSWRHKQTAVNKREMNFTQKNENSLYLTVLTSP